VSRVLKTGMIALLIVLSVAAAACAITSVSGWLQLTDWQGWKIASTEIPVRDGSRLAADIYLPSAGKSYPVILVQTPYSKERHKKVMENIINGNPEAPLFKSRDYAFAVLDWRGFFQSKDTARVTPGKEQRGEDGFDAVEWIGQQSWCNGKVSTWGQSALGNIQFLTAAQSPPHLVSASPTVYNIVTGYENYYSGGVMRKDYVDTLANIGFAGLSSLIKQHPTDDGTYNRNAIDPSLIAAPMLLVGGWYDYNNMFQTYRLLSEKSDEKVRKNHRLVIGPWTHQGAVKDIKQGEVHFPNAAPFAREEQKKFFDHYARGIDTGEKDSPPIKYFVMGSNQWQSANIWPPEGVTENTLYLAEGGKLTARKGSDGVKPDGFVSDPLNPVPTLGGAGLDPNVPTGSHDQRDKVESRSDVLCYTTEVLDSDLTIAGRVKLKLYVSSDRVDTDVAVRLTDVHPDGRSMLVTDGIQRMSLRDSVREKKLLTPGQVYAVTVTMPDTAMTFLKGHRIRVSVSSSNYPRYDLNSNNGLSKGDALVASNLLFHETKYPSALLLPVIK